jgi:uncharacterized protein (TIGR01244 family)
MSQIRRVDETISVAPQIAVTDIAAIKAAGFVGIINNRPDGESDDQPPGDSIRDAALEAGLTYEAIPVTHAGFSFPQVEKMAEALEEAKGPILAFCRSGTRSCNLWALAKAKLGEHPAVLVEKGESAGYDLSGIRPVLDQLAAQA